MSADASWTSFGHDAQIDRVHRRAGASPPQVKGFSLVWKAQLDGGDHRLAARCARSRGTGSSSSPRPTRATSTRSGPTAHVLWERSIGTVDARTATAGPTASSSTGVDRHAARRPLRRRRDRNAPRPTADRRHRRAGVARASRVTRTRTEFVWGGLRLLGDHALRPDRLVLRRARPARRACRRPARRGSTSTAACELARRLRPGSGPDNLGGIWGWGGVAVYARPVTALFTGVGNAEPDVDNGSSDSMVELTHRSLRGRSRPIGLSSRDDRVRTQTSAPRRCSSSRLGCPALLAANVEIGRAPRLAAGPRSTRSMRGSR